MDLAALALLLNPQFLNNELRAAGLAHLQQLDAQGLVDWAGWDAQGEPFLHALTRAGGRPDILAWALDTHGPAALTWRNAQGETLLDLALVNAANPLSEQHSLQVALTRATPEQLAEVDPPGAPWGEGWYERVRALDSEYLLAALAQQGITAHQDPGRLARSLHHLTAKALPEILAQRSLSADVVLAPGLVRPLWAHTIERGISLTPHLASDPRLDTAQVQAWGKLRQMQPAKGQSHVSKATLLETLQALPERLTTRDDLGRPALWQACLKNPGLVRELVGRHPDLIDVEDRTGHGWWFHAFSLLLRGEEGIHLDLIPSLPQPPAGLIAQWFTLPFEQFTALAPPFTERPTALPKAALSWAQHWTSDPALWAMDAATAQVVGTTWMQGTHPALVGLANTFAVHHTCMDEKKLKRVCVEGPWMKLVAEHPAWPALRGPMAVVIWRQLCKDLHRSKSTYGPRVTRYPDQLHHALTHLSTLPWQALPSTELAAFAAEVAQGPEELRALGNDCLSRFLITNRQAVLQARPAAPDRPRRPRA